MTIQNDSWLEVINGTRLRLVPFTGKHIQATYVSWLNNAEIMRFTNQRFRRHSVASCLAYLESLKDTSNRFFAVEDINSGELMGTLTMFIYLHHQTADVGILIGETGLWGKGYGQEAFALAVDTLFGSGKIRKVTAGTMACNVMMIKIMQKCGMTLEATQKDQELVDGEPFDILYFAKFVNTDVPSTANASPKP